MRIYIADLAAYNAGVLRGKWWDPTDFADADDFGTAVQEWIEGIETEHGIEGMTAEMLAERAAGYYIPEEYAIHDYEDTFGIRLSEYATLESVWELAGLLGEHGQAWADYRDHVGADATEEGFKDTYCGEWGSGADYVQQYYEDTVPGPKPDRWNREARGWYERAEDLARYVDWRQMWREWEMSGYYISKHGNVFSPS